MKDETQPENMQESTSGCRSARSQATEAAALALAQGQTVVKAAELAGVAERTLYLWLNKPAFKKRIIQLRDRITDQSVGALTRFSTAAIAVLAGLLKSASEEIKFKASRTIMELLVKVRDHAEFSRRLEALEEKASPKRTGK